MGEEVKIEPLQYTAKRDMYYNKQIQKPNTEQRIPASLWDRLFGKCYI